MSPTLISIASCFKSLTFWDGRSRFPRRIPASNSCYLLAFFDWTVHQQPSQKLLFPMWRFNSSSGFTIKSHLTRVSFFFFHWASRQLALNPTRHFQQKLLWLLWALNMKLYSQHLNGVFHLSDGSLDSNFSNGFAPIVQLKTKSTVSMLIIHVGAYPALYKSVSVCTFIFCFFFLSEFLDFIMLNLRKSTWQQPHSDNHFPCFLSENKNAPQILTV